MPHEYDDPVTPEAIEAAARMVGDLARQQPEVPLDRHVAVAVHRTFCGCVTGIEDEIEGGLSGVHGALLRAVAARAADMRETIRVDDWDLVDESSAQSFPASDPPAWVGGRPRELGQGTD